MKRIAEKLLLMLIILIAPDVSYGENIHRFHLDYRDGLCGNNIRSIGQDGYGYVWVATGDGLNQFDGRRFKSYTKENSGLESNELNCVVGDPTDKNIVWISTRTAGLYKYDHRTGEITQMGEGVSTPDIPWLSVTADEKIWVTNYFGSPDLLDPSTSKVTPLYKSLPRDFSTPIWCAVQDREGKYLYIGHEHAGMSRVDLHTKQHTGYFGEHGNPQNLPAGAVYAIEVDSNGLVWLGTDDGALMFDPQTEKFTPVRNSTDPSSMLPGPVRVIKEMSDGDLWLGTLNGGVSILHFSDRINGNLRFDNITSNEGMRDDENVTSPYIWAIFEDSYGNTWIGHYTDGIDVMSYEKPFFVAESPFQAYSSHNSDMAVWSALVDGRDRMWIGGVNQIMNVENSTPEIVRLPTFGTPGSAQVKTLFADRKGLIWVGTSNAGAYTYDPDRHTFESLGLKEKEIRAFAQDADGTMWIGTHSGIYSSKDGTTIEADSVRNSQLADIYITALVVDSHDNLWVGTFGKGLMVFNPEGKRTLWLQTSNGLPSHTINAIRDDGKGNMWMATRGGAVRVPISQKGKLLTVTHEDGMPSSDIRSVEIDKSGNVWLAANRSITRFNPDTGELLAHNRIYSTQLVSFAENASCADISGRLYFGLLSGLIYFSPDHHEHERQASSVTLTELRVNDSKAPNQSLEIDIPVTTDKIELPYNHNTFTLKFNSLDITQAANSDLSYNMEGVNEVWTTADASNEAIYRNMKPGEYKFRIRHRLHGKGWSEPIMLARITITPPVYLTWWAILLYVAALVIIVTLFILFYKHKLLLEKNLAVEKEHSMNIRALNEERMIFFTNITHELRTPLSLIIGPIEDLVNDTSLKDTHRQKLHTIRSSSMRLLNLINGILEFRKTETQHRRLEVVYGSIANFVREIGLRFKELNNNKNVNIVIDVEQLEGEEIYYDAEMITTIINNLMGNAVKYTAKGTITLSLRKLEVNGVRYIDLIVTDTGVGISKADLPHIFKRYYQAENAKRTSGTGIGLALTKNLVELHEGTISVASQEGKGSVFTVRLVMDNSYPAAKHRGPSDADSEELSDGVRSLSGSESGKLSLLVVEDDEDVRTYISQAFSDDFKVYTASNGTEGLSMARVKLPDIIVSDIMMPEMDGIELCRAIKNDITTSHIPVILLTAKDSILDKEEGYESGADSYLTKPFSTNLLKSRINNIVESRHNITLRMLGLVDTARSDTEPTGKMSETTDDTAVKPDIQPASSQSERPPEGQAKLSRLDQEFITKFSRLVEDNMEMEDLDQTFLADKMCMSLSTLYRKVKSISGLTPNEFIRKIKLRHAAALILAKDVPLTEIYALTGFGSAAYFRRVFKKEFGVSPSEYAPGHIADQADNPNPTDK